MTTLSRLQAFYWSNRLGSLDAAADRLHVSASAISKRLRELQAEADVELFSIVRKGLVLTPAGEEVLHQTEELIMEMAHLDALKMAPLASARVVSIGLTELTAMTWFRTFIHRLQSTYPDLIVIPIVDQSGIIRQKLLTGQLDLAILQQAYIEPEMSALKLGSTPFDWFCKPGLLPRHATISMQALGKFPLIEQGAESGLTALGRSLFAEAGLEPVRKTGSNSFIALLALLEAGLGVSCIPRVLVRRSIQSGRLQRLRTEIPAPIISFSAAFMPQHNPSIGWTLAALARDCCSFRMAA